MQSVGGGVISHGALNIDVFFEHSTGFLVKALKNVSVGVQWD